MRVVFADLSRQAYDYQEIFVGKPQHECPPTRSRSDGAGFVGGSRVTASLLVQSRCLFVTCATSIGHECPPTRSRSDGAGFVGGSRVTASLLVQPPCCLIPHPDQRILADREWRIHLRWIRPTKTEGARDQVLTTAPASLLHRFTVVAPSGALLFTATRSIASGLNTHREPVRGPSFGRDIFQKCHTIWQALP
jgi:hypothetical protein